MLINITRFYYVLTVVSVCSYILTLVFDGQKQYRFAWFRTSLAILFQQTLNTTMNKHGTCFIVSADALRTLGHVMSNRNIVVVLLADHLVFPTYMNNIIIIHRLSIMTTNVSYILANVSLVCNLKNPESKPEKP